MRELIKNNVYRITAVLTIVIVFFIYRSYSDKYKLTLELEVDYKIFLTNTSFYQDSLFSTKVKYLSDDVDYFFNYFKENNIPLNRYFKGVNDEEIISTLKNEISEKSDECLERMNGIIKTNNIDVRVQKLENGNFQVKCDMTEDWYKVLKLFTSPEMPLPLRKVEKFIL